MKELSVFEKLSFVFLFLISILFVTALKAGEPDEALKAKCFYKNKVKDCLLSKNTGEVYLKLPKVILLHTIYVEDKLHIMIKDADQ